MPIIYVDGGFYVIGGRIDNDSMATTIGRLDSVTQIWSKAGDLVYGRRAHNAIFDGSSIIVVGGMEGKLKTEKCEISDGQVTCKAQNPALESYAYLPELFLVDDGFCKTLP